MAFFAVTYTYGTGTDAVRDQYRPVHVDFLRASYEAGRLRVSGPFTDGDREGALLIWECDSRAELLAEVETEPFYAQGVVETREIKEWKIVFGGIEDAR